MPKDVHNDTNYPDDNIANEDNGETNINGMLMFLNKVKLKVDATLQLDTWLYNEIMTLKKIVKDLQEILENEKTKRIELERKVRKILDKLITYEAGILQEVFDTAKDLCNSYPYLNFLL